MTMLDFRECTKLSVHWRPFLAAQVCANDGYHLNGWAHLRTLTTMGRRRTRPIARRTERSLSPENFRETGVESRTDSEA